MPQHKRASEQELQNFTARLRDVAGDNLVSLILYGSAASGEADAYSDLNLLCVLRDLSFSHLASLSKVVESWTRKNQRLPLFISEKELKSSTDVFAIELLDIRQHHKLLFGKDLLKDLEIPMGSHRAQLEYELREKLILLRQRLLLVAGDDARILDLLLHSFPAFITLFRHLLIAQGKPAPATKSEAVQMLLAQSGSDAELFQQLLQARTEPKSATRLNARAAAQQYLAFAERLTEMVDGLPDLG